MKYSERYEIWGILEWGQNCFSDALGYRNSIHLSVFMFIIITAISQLLLSTAYLGRVGEFPTAIWKFILEMSTGEPKRDMMLADVCGIAQKRRNSLRQLAYRQPGCLSLGVIKIK